MKKLLLALLMILAFSRYAYGQQIGVYSNPQGGNLTAAGATCATVNACTWQKIPITASTTTVTITGTFSATLIIETSADGGNTFTTQSSQTAPAVVTFASNSFTDVRVRCSAFVSGSAAVNIQTGLNGITPNGGSSSSGSSFTQVTTLPATCTPGTTAPVILNLNGRSFGPFFCSATNVFTPDNTAQKISPLSFGAKFDVKFSGNCTFTISTTVNCTGGDIAFTSADIGKIEFGTTGTTQINSNQLNSVLAIAQGTITAVNSATQVVVSIASTANCTPSSTTACTFAYGTQDDATAINLAATAAFNTAGATCAMEFPAGAAFIGTSVLNGQSTNQCMGSSPNSGVLADTTSTGPVVNGQGPGATTLVLLPSFNFASCTTGSGSTSCNGTTPNLHIYNFAVNGLQNPVGGTHAVTLWEAIGGSGGGVCDGGVTVWNMSFSNFGLTAANSLNGFGFGSQSCNDSTMWNVNVSSFGAIPCVWNGAGNTNNAYGLLCFGASSYVFGLRGTANSILNTYGSQFLTVMNNNVATISCGGSIGQTWNSTGDLFGPSVNSSGLTVTSVAICNAGSANMNFDRATMAIPTTTTGTSQIFFLNASNVVHMRNSVVTATGTNNRFINLGAGDTFFDDGGNTIKNGTVANTITGGYFGSASVTGVTPAGSAFGISACGTTAAPTVAAGSTTRAGSITLTIAGGPVTACTITYTFPATSLSPFMVAPSKATLTGQGGTVAAFPTSITRGAVSTTSAAWTINGTFATGNTVTLDYDVRNE